MSDQHKHELEISEQSYKQAVLVMKFLEAAGDPHDEVNSLGKQAENCLSSDSSSIRAFGLNLLRFLYKKGMISMGFFLKRRIRGLLKSDPSKSVRLAAFDLLGAVLSNTGSKSGVRESDYATILDFRAKMIERSPKLRQYESSGVREDIKQLNSNEGIQLIVDRIIADFK